MKAVTRSTLEYFRPFEPKYPTILSVSYDTDKNVFVCATYERTTDEHGIEYAIQCRDRHAYNFYNRFRHGRTLINKSLPYAMWECPANDYSYQLIRHTWRGELRLTTEADSKLKELAIRDLCLEVSATAQGYFKERLASFIAAKRLQGGGDNNSITNEAIGYSSQVKLPPEIKLDHLRPFQLCAADIADNLDGYGLLMGMGAGKTATAIAIADRYIYRLRKETQRPIRILIVCPKGVRNNWQREISRWSNYNGKSKVSVISGMSEDIRGTRTLLALLPDNMEQVATIVIVNYETVVNTEILRKVQWDLTIADESHLIRNPSIKRTKAMLELRDVSAKRILLTGTAICNSPLDLYTQLEFIGKGVSNFNSFHAFNEFYTQYEVQSYSGHRQIAGYANIPMLQEIVAKHCFVLSKEEALPFLPEKWFDTIEVSMTDEQCKAYNAALLQLQHEYDMLSKKDSMTINNHLTKMLRLAQITSGYAVTDESGIYRFDPNPKLEELVDILKDKDEDSKTIVWCLYEENIKQIQARLCLEGIDSVSYYGATSDKDRQMAEYRFNCDPKCKVFVGNAAAGGIGLNLVGFDVTRPDEYTTNADHVIHFTRNWQSDVYRQSTDRAHRLNTRVSVRISNLIVPRSIDQIIIDRVNDKIEISNEVHDIKNILQEIIGMKAMPMIEN